MCIVYHHFNHIDIVSAIRAFTIGSGLWPLRWSPVSHLRFFPFTGVSSKSSWKSHYANQQTIGSLYIPYHHHSFCHPRLMKCFHHLQTCEVQLCQSEPMKQSPHKSYSRLWQQCHLWGSECCQKVGTSLSSIFSPFYAPMLQAVRISMVLGEIMATYSYVLLPDIIRSSGNLQSIVPTKTQLLLDLFHSIEVFLELCTWSEYVIQLCNGTDFSKMVTGRAGSLHDAPAQHLTPFECRDSTGSPGNRFKSSVRLVSCLTLEGCWEGLEG